MAINQGIGDGHISGLAAAGLREPDAAGGSATRNAGTQAASSAGSGDAGQIMNSLSTQLAGSGASGFGTLAAGTNSPAERGQAQADPAQLEQLQGLLQSLQGNAALLTGGYGQGRRPLPQGSWEGRDQQSRAASLLVGKDGAMLSLANGTGSISPPPQLNRRGEFRAAGTFTTSGGATKQAYFSGSLRDGVLSIQVTGKRGRMLGSASLQQNTGGGPTTPVARGAWGLPGAAVPRLDVNASGATFNGGARSGTIGEPLRADANGNFRAMGSYKFGPPASLAPEVQAIYSGRVRNAPNGQFMELNISRADGTPLDSVRLQLLGAGSGGTVPTGQYTNGDPRADGALLDVTQNGSTYTFGRGVRSEINGPLRLNGNGGFNASGTFTSGTTGFQPVPANFTGTYERGTSGQPARINLTITDTAGRVLHQNHLTFGDGAPPPPPTPVPAGRYTNGNPAADGSFLDVGVNGAQYSAGLGGGGEITQPLQTDARGNFRANGTFTGIGANFRTVPATYTGAYRPAANGQPARLDLRITDQAGHLLGRDQLTLEPVPPPSGRVPNGPWSGSGTGGNISMNVRSNDTDLQIGQALGAPGRLPAYYGRINGPLATDARGRFSVQGTLDPSIKPAIFPPPPPFNVTYSGQASGNQMTLKITGENGRDFGAYSLRQGRPIDPPPLPEPDGPPALSNLSITRNKDHSVTARGTINLPDPAWQLTTRTETSGNTLRVYLNATRDPNVIAPQVISPRTFSVSASDPKGALRTLLLHLPSLFGQPARTLRYDLPLQSGTGMGVSNRSSGNELPQ
ncbi:MAG: hypothetical protein ACKV2V_18045 [Blastocatellia bacterium]